MGFVKPTYSLFDFDFNETTRTVRETLDYFPTIKSKSVAMKLVDYAYNEIKSTISKRKELNCKLIVQKIYKFMDEYARIISKPGDLKLLYTPHISGGRNYNLNHLLVKENNTFEFDTIQIGIGIIYRGYYSNYVRTLLINPTEQVKNNYNFQQLIQRVILFNLRDGADLFEVYGSVVSFAKNENQYLEQHLEKIFGCILDPKLRNDFVICSDAKSIAKYGMIFAININLMGLEEGGKYYNLRHINTIFVKKDEPAELLTNTLQIQDEIVFDINKHSGLVNSS